MEFSTCDVMSVLAKIPIREHFGLWISMLGMLHSYCYYCYGEGTRLRRVILPANRMPGSCPSRLLPPSQAVY